MKNISNHLKNEFSNGRLKLSLLKQEQKSFYMLAAFAVFKELSNLTVRSFVEIKINPLTEYVQSLSFILKQSTLGQCKRAFKIALKLRANQWG